MSTATLEKPYTPEDLLAMEDGDRFELINGELVERNTGAESDFVGQTLNASLVNHVETQTKGLVFGPKTGYQMFADDEDRVRFPDGSYIRPGRLPDDRPPLGHVRIAPDLAHEVVSPNDTADEIEAKVIDFLNAGVRLIWVLYPRNRTIHVYRRSGPPSHLSQTDELSGEDVLPGFVCKVSDLFAGIGD